MSTAPRYVKEFYKAANGVMLDRILKLIAKLNGLLQQYHQGYGAPDPSRRIILWTCH